MYKFPGDYNLKKLELITHDGVNKIDIRNLTLELNIFESIYQPSITCEIVITDAIGLIEGAPLFGQEKVLMEIDTPNSPDNGTDDPSFIKEFMVYKISKRGIDSTQGANIYILHLCTKDFMIGNSITVSGSYYGTPSQICRKLFKDTFPTENKKIAIEETLRETVMVYPNTNLFKSINMLCNYAQTDKHNTSTFLFYEDHLNGYNFTSVETLLKKEPKKFENYFFENTSNIQNSITSPKRNFIIRNMEMIKDFDSLIGISSGMFSSKTISHDIVTKTIKTTSYNYDKDFSDSDSIYSNPLIKKTSVNFQYSNSVYSDNTTYLFSTDSARKESNYVKQKTSDLDLNHYHVMDEVIGGRVSKLHQIDYMKMKIDIPGDLRLYAGKIINIFIPTISKKTNNKETLDKRLSGKYLITNITHTFSRNQYSTKCEVIKDSFETDIKFNDGVNNAI